jgi:methylglutaconyl-CoA hydratase
MTEAVVLSEVDARGVATVRLNRPHRANAYNSEMMDGARAAVAALAEDRSVRVLVLRGVGRNFSAGADLAYQRELGASGEAANRDFSTRTIRTMYGLNEFPRPTVAVVQGACFGGGIGFAACCDIAIGASNTIFGLTEVRVGVIPSPIQYQLDRAIGTRAARRYGVTGERFDAEEARRIGLLHEVVAPEALDAAVEDIIAALLAGGPEALAASKALILDLSDTRLDEARVAEMAAISVGARISAEAHEGLSAFLEKRPPAWAAKP